MNCFNFALNAKVALAVGLVSKITVFVFFAIDVVLKITYEYYCARRMCDSATTIVPRLDTTGANGNRIIERKTTNT